jgi:hypothetical protein
MRADVRAVLLPGRPARFTPFDLGTGLYDLWDAERAGDLSLSGAAVTAWTSAKNGYSAAQSTGASRPAYSATSFNGRPGVTFDGADDELTYAGVGVFPTGASPCEIWVLADQAAMPPGSTAARIVFGLGATATAQRRSLQRAVVSSANVAQLEVGNGAGANTASGPGVFSGRTILRAISGATTARVDQNGVAGTAAAVVPNIGTTRTRIGATTANTAANFFQGVVSLIAVTELLSDLQAGQMLAFLKTRGGIA